MSSIPRSAFAAVAVMLLLVLAVLYRGRLLARKSTMAAIPVAASWTTDIENARDHVTPEQLTSSLLQDPDSVVLVDLRPADEFAAFHLPGAKHLDLPVLFGPEGEQLLAANADRTVVLYSNGMVHPAQAWSQLAARGHANVRVLEGGLTQLFDDVLTPPSLRGPIDEGRARAIAVSFAAARSLYLEGQSMANSQEPARFASDPEHLATPTIVSTAWVADRVDRIVLLDARSEAGEYAAAHLHGARHLPIAQTRAPRGDVPDELRNPAELARLFGDAGIDANTEVVVYAGAKLFDATHLLLALATVGHTRMAILEGGLSAWLAEGRSLTDAVPKVEVTPYEVASELAAIDVPLEQVVQASRTGEPAILDVRPASEFAGIEEKEVRGGHMPLAVNRSSTDDLVTDAAGVWLRPRSELLDIYAKLGFTPDRPIVVSCRTGHKASQTWFVLRHVLGFQNVKWYDGSWQEWSKHPELPAETAAIPPR